MYFMYDNNDPVVGDAMVCTYAPLAGDVESR